ncbi:MAG: hypothetical protein J0H42_29685 [Rhizobiales bacterium]|nr:hypothetical protein [Hyphomicrobiales bacterium]
MKKGHFEDGDLYRLLPSVIRHRDSLIDGKPLERVLRQFGKRADRLEEKIEESYVNLFIETCGPQELAYIADLVGYRPILGEPKAAKQAVNGVKPSAGGAGCDDPPKLSLRRDIAKTIWARRRKGTADVLGQIVRLIAGWHTVVFENNREVVSTPSIRYAGASRSQGTPDLRKLIGRNRIDQGPGLVPRVGTVRRADVHAERGRWHPLDVVVEAWSRRAGRRNVDLSSVKHSSELTVCPNGGDLQLYGTANADGDATRIIESARAIYLSDFEGGDATAVKKQIYGAERVICLYEHAAGHASIPPTAVDRDLVTFGSVSGQATAALWVIDPERGRVLPPSGNSNPASLRCYLPCKSEVSADAENVVKVRLNEHVPLEARTGVVLRS